MRFDDSLIQTEFAPTERCGYFYFTFPSGNASVVLANRLAGDLRFENNAVLGEENFDGMKAYVYGEFSSPITPNQKTLKKGSSSPPIHPTRSHSIFATAFPSSARNRQSKIFATKFPHGD